MVNATMNKFGYPRTLVREFEHWVLLLRPAQVTAGSMVLAAKSEAESFAELEPDAFAELAEVIPVVENLGRSTIGADKMNYLMLMMVDKYVHFHVFPRYEGSRRFVDIDIEDHGWPGPPALEKATQLTPDKIEAGRKILENSAIPVGASRSKS